MKRATLDVFHQGEQVSTQTFSIQNTKATCTQCKTFGSLEIVYGRFNTSSALEEEFGKIVLSCPECDTWMNGILHQSWSNQETLEVIEINGSEKEAIMDEEILKISPEFPEIFNEAREMERQGFKNAGIVYRKSLEYLIKDYAISKAPSESGKIKSSPLAAVIKQHISLELLRECAEGATWLGNDETHYQRKHESMDIEDLKKLINLTIHVILAEVYAVMYKDRMR